MSQPGIPDITPEISLSRDQVLTLLLASIAVEEMGLAHLLNAEAEKMQHVISLESENEASFGQLICANHTVERVIKSVTRLQLLLSEKLDNVIMLIGTAPCPTPDPPPPIPPLCCRLCGRGSGTICNSEDGFIGAKATLSAPGEPYHSHPFKYTLSKQSKKGPISGRLVPFSNGLIVECRQNEPCLGLEGGTSLLITGRGVMCIKVPCMTAKHGTVYFKLKVCSNGSHTRFEIKTWLEDQELYCHESGIVEVSQGDLQIKVGEGVIT